ncbi:MULTISPECIES: ferritin-like domain-containing protein [unclassified Bacillus (in: firmicutes)]|uniref:ferritin-like domain-containing protein n=1 Tax=unclassified Bacillus (in: firmicutes) TaxID=185979 RepID=UPI000BEF9BAC|nr:MULTISPECIES: ferritin-like domain-containing protein [unclassified Bacillus (in: firmicutes)]PEJ59557.1 rubrerythrin family protein [Bacillus sp. AFS002410]PEL13622.1 rubrerythrin family protein [Bacillus sp. AFS017336]
MYSYQNPNNYYDYYRQLNAELERDIEKAINLKYNAINCLAQLGQQAPNDATKVVINEIREDDVRHYEAFQQVYRILTGRTIEAKITQVCGKTFKQGIEALFIGEQYDSRFYLKIADSTTNQTVKNVFNRAAIEDGIHANWFLYFMIKTK